MQNYPACKELSTSASHDMGQLLFPFYFSNYVWEIMHSTISKMSKHVEKLQKEAEEARDLLDAAKKKVHKKGPE